MTKGTIEFFRSARDLAVADFKNLVQGLSNLGSPTVVAFDGEAAAAAANAERTVINLVIGTRGDLAARDAAAAARQWRDIRARIPEAIIIVSIAGYDQSRKEIWEFTEARRFVRRWARLAGLADPATAMREIGNDRQFPHLLAILTLCGTFGADPPFDIAILPKWRWPT